MAWKAHWFVSIQSTSDYLSPLQCSDILLDSLNVSGLVLLHFSCDLLKLLCIHTICRGFSFMFNTSPTWLESWSDNYWWCYGSVTVIVLLLAEPFRRWTQVDGWHSVNHTHVTWTPHTPCTLEYLYINFVVLGTLFRALVHRTLNSIVETIHAVNGICE